MSENRPYWPHSNPDQPEDNPYCHVCDQRERVGTSLMCGGCYTRLRADITTLVGAHTWLGIAMLTPTPAWKPGTIGHSATSSRPPFRTDLHDARVEIATLLTSWAQAIAETHVPALAGPADNEPTTIGVWLRARTHWLSEQDWCVDVCAELGDAARRAYGLVPWERQRRELPLPCPGCGYLTLTLYGGNELIVCRYRDCAKELTWSDYWAAVVEASQQAKADTPLPPNVISPPPTPTSEGIAA